MVAIRRRTLLLFLLLAAGGLYGLWLRYSPIYLHDAEVLFALHARSIATSLHDANGRFLPLYFQMPSIGPNVWFHPMLVYWSAPFLKVLPLSEWSIRLPTVCLGLANIALMYLVARRMFQREAYGVLAAALLALTPAHFIHSRLAMDYIYPVPFVLLWLLCLLRFEQNGSRRQVFVAGVVLGIGFYSYISSVAMMPLYLALTWMFLFHKYRRFNSTYVLALIGFCLPLVVCVTWLLQHPTVYADTFVRYDATRLGPLRGVRDFLRYNSIQEHVSRYWNFNNPTYLFFVGSSNLVNSTRTVGVFLLPLALFLLAGLYDVLTRERTRIGWLVVAGFVTAPLAAVVVDEPWAIYRELGVLPFAVLLATFGVRRLLGSERRVWRAVAVTALAAMPLQFAYFANDYFTNYRLNSNAWFGSNLRGAVDEILEQDRQGRAPSAVYLSTTIPYARERWQLYLAMAEREDLLRLTYPFDGGTTVATMPRRSVVVAPMVDGAVADPRVSSSELRKVHIVTEPDGAPSFVLFER